MNGAIQVKFQRLPARIQLNLAAEILLQKENCEKWLISAGFASNLYFFWPPCSKYRNRQDSIRARGRHRTSSPIREPVEDSIDKRVPLVSTVLASIKVRFYALARVRGTEGSPDHAVASVMLTQTSQRRLHAVRPSQKRAKPGEEVSTGRRRKREAGGKVGGWTGRVGTKERRKEEGV